LVRRHGRRPGDRHAADVVRSTRRRPVGVCRPASPKSATRPGRTTFDYKATKEEIIPEQSLLAVDVFTKEEMAQINVRRV
jgi:hypothetical protein